MSWSWQLRLKPAPKIIDDSEGMASRDQHSQQQNQTRKVPLFPLLSLVCFVSIFLLLSSIRKTSVPPRPHNASFEFQKTEGSNPSLRGGSCDYSDGSWIRSPDDPPRYDNTCKEIFKGWNCISSDKSNGRELLKWRWRPKGCDLPPFHPIRFLKMYRDTSIGFVGDSLNRNMFVSLFCSLKRVSSEVKKWRPAGADRGFTFLHSNLTLAYHRTNLLARYGRWSADANGGVLESLGYKEGYRVDVENLFSVKNNGTNVEARLVNQHLYKSLKGSSFQILNITHMSEFRADAHPSTAGGKKHDDCMHWCMPGLTDTWNDLFIKQLNVIRSGN